MKMSQTYSLKIFFIFICFLTFGCDSSVNNNQHTKILQNNNQSFDISNNQTEYENISELINLLGEGNRLQQEKNLQNLLNLVEKNPDIKNKVSTSILDETQKLCKKNDVIVSPTDFFKLKNMSLVLGILENTEGLNTLIDCANHRSGITDLSNYYATEDGILKYKEKAVPILSEKLITGAVVIKCRAARILWKIDKMKAKLILKNRLKFEHDPIVIECITDNLNG